MSKAKKSGKRLYEGLFLFDPARINSSIAQATQIVTDLLARAEAEVHSIAKWDDRKLAYEIHGVKRGLYMLAYFHCDGVKVESLERDVKLSEDVLRALVIRADHMGDAELELAKNREAESLDAARLEAAGEGEGEGEANAKSRDDEDDEETVDEEDEGGDDDTRAQADQPATADAKTD